jgi:hypothetical protein
MTGSKQDSTSCLSLPDDVTSSGCAHDTVLTEQQLLDTICSTNLCNELHDLWVVVTAISSNDKEAVLDTFWDREKDGGNKGLRVVLLLEHLDLLAKTRTVRVVSLLAEKRLKVAP